MGPSVILVVCLGVALVSTAPPPTPYYQPDYSYQPAPYYSPPEYPVYSAPQYSYKKDYYQEYYPTYDVQTDYNELEISYNCGAKVAINENLYPGDISGYGEFPWTVVITDDYNKFLCQGTVVQGIYILTAASCVEGYSYDKLKVRWGIWDLLSDNNAHVVYHDYDTYICAKWPIPMQDYKPSYGYQQPQYNSYSDLVLLATSLVLADLNQFPHINSCCLPYIYTPTYYAPQYPAQYGYGSPQYNSYNPPQYQTYDPPQYAECWVDGWYASKTSQLQTISNEFADYGYQSSYYGYDQSKVQRKAKVKEIKCPAYNDPYGKSQSYGDDKICFVGVESYDACVTDKGAAVFCYVDEHASTPNYFNDYQQDYNSYSSKQDYYNTYVIKKAMDKIYSQRAVLYAVVQQTTDCTVTYKAGYGSYNSYDNTQSKHIVATKINQKAVEFIENKNMNVEYQCAPASYDPPQYYPSTPYYPAPQYYDPPAPYYPAPQYYDPPAPYYPAPQYYDPPAPYYQQPYYSSQ